MSKHQIQPGYGDEQADAGRDSRTRLATPNYQAQTGFHVQITTRRIGSLARFIYNLLCDDLKYTHTVHGA